MMDRAEIIYEATGVWMESEIEASGSVGEGFLYGYHRSNPHFVSIVAQNFTKIGLGIYKNRIAEQFAY